MNIHPWQNMSTLENDGNNGAFCASVGRGTYEKSLYLLFNFVTNLKLLLKINPLKNNYTKKIFSIIRIFHKLEEWKKSTKILVKVHIYILPPLEMTKDKKCFCLSSIPGKISYHNISYLKSMTFIDSTLIVEIQLLAFLFFPTYNSQGATCEILL